MPADCSACCRPGIASGSRHIFAASRTPARSAATAWSVCRSRCAACVAAAAASPPCSTVMVPAMLDVGLQVLRRHHVLGRFWKSARGFWHGPTARLAWGLIALLVVITVLQLLVQYRLNLWNRDFFNALE